LSQASPPFITLCMSDAPGQREAALAPALVVRDAAQAAAALALAAGREVLLLSAPGAAGLLGAGGWRALVAAAARDAPGAPFRDALCCAAAPGLALGALRAGCRILVLDGACAGFGQVAGAAASVGAALLPARPAALDLSALDLGLPHGRRILSAWLTPRPDDSGRASE
jgi:hypothetical protein